MIHLKYELAGQAADSSPKDCFPKCGNDRHMKPRQPDSPLNAEGESIDAHAYQKNRAPSQPSLFQSLDYAPLQDAQRRSRPVVASGTQPRWHNQSYMLFLALRQHPGHCLPRIELIKNALELDKRVSEERHIPRVFRGKTPMNSASAILTNNNDRYFIPFKPEGSRSKHFRLSVKPSSFVDSAEEYHAWERKLIKNDWPFCFGSPSKPSSASVASLDILSEQETRREIQAITEFDQFMASRKRKRRRREDENKENKVVFKPEMRSVDNPAPICGPIDLASLPKRWQDVVQITDTGSGLFALRSIPANTPLGFYFGVPMTEDEFDSLKSGVGRASELCIMYQNNVLDATDEHGKCYSDDLSGVIYCPFHYIKDTVNDTLANIVFLEGLITNQIICCTKRDIEANEELFRYAK